MPGPRKPNSLLTRGGKDRRGRIVGQSHRIAARIRSGDSSGPHQARTARQATTLETN